MQQKYELTLSIPYNTTIRSILQFQNEAVSILKAAPTLTCAQFRTAGDLTEELIKIMNKAAGTNRKIHDVTVNKLLLEMGRLGLSEYLPYSAGGRWLAVHPAGATFMNINPSARLDFLRHLTLTIPSPKMPDRPNITTLMFISESNKRGIRPTTPEVAVYRGSRYKETGWAPKVTQMENDRIACANLDSKWPQRVKHRKELIAAIRHGAAALVSLSCKTPHEVEVAMLTHDLVRGCAPGAKKSSRMVVAAKIAEPAIAGDAGRVERLCMGIYFERRVESIYDGVLQHLRNLVDFGLLSESKNSTGQSEFTLTALGEKSLLVYATRPRTYAAGKEEQRNSVSFPNLHYGLSGNDTLVALFTKDKNDPVGVVKSLTDSVTQSPACFEFNTIRAVAACTHQSSVNQLINAARTKLGASAEPLSPAPGGGPDGIVTTVNRDIVVEATQIVGRSQVSKELEPITRHCQDHGKLVDRAVIGVFVAPEIDWKMAGFLLYDSLSGETGGSKNVIPINIYQLGRIVQSGVDLDCVLDEIERRSASLGPVPNGQKYLTVIDQTINDLVRLGN